MFDHSNGVLSQNSQEEMIKTELATMCGQQEVTIHTPEKFSRLVEYLRHVDFELLASLATSAICPESKLDSRSNNYIIFLNDQYKL